MALKVIGAGGPRTGTASLRKALEMLSFSKCYHMKSILQGIVTVFVLITFINCSHQKKTQTEALNESSDSLSLPPELVALAGLDRQRGILLNSDKATPGYILFSSITSAATHLMNLNGEVVHIWQSELGPLSEYLMDNGHLIRGGREPEAPVFAGGGMGGRIQEFSWEGELLWDYKYADEQHLMHHDFAVMPNGNILAIAWETKTVDEAKEAGRKPELIPPAGIWPDMVIEIEPQKPSGGKIIWEWHAWDHMIQDYDPDLSNYGKIPEHPELIDINFIDSIPHISQEELDKEKAMGMATSNTTVENYGSDMFHTNAISYNADLDQIVLSVPELSEIWIIDHSTTTEEAAGHSGGRWGKGGDLLYRWGNPQNYGRGDSTTQQLGYQHDVRWIPEGLPGAGHLTIFNNNARGPEGAYSEVIEIVPPTHADGSYIIPENGPMGPDTPAWNYAAADKKSFHAPFISSAHRLSNGNTLVNSGPQGRFFEVTPEGEVFWEYWSPYIGDVRLPDGSTPQPVGPFVYAVFRTTHIPADHPALTDKELVPLNPQPEIKQKL